MLISSFHHNARQHRSDSPLSDDQLRHIAPSIFAAQAHGSRSGRYTHIPTSTVLAGLRREGFAPFMVCQTQVREQGKRDFAKHMVRLRHATQINDREANEVILLNSHDGSSSYQLLSGLFRFVCANGLVCGDTLADVRVRHQGDIVHDVIAGAHEVLEGFHGIRERRDAMRAVSLKPEEARAFATAALALKYEPDPTRAAPITEAQVLALRRGDDAGTDLWGTFNVVQENLIRGGLPMRSANGRRVHTRAVHGIDQSVKLNRALWILAEQMRALKA